MFAVVVVVIKVQITVDVTVYYVITVSNVYSLNNFNLLDYFKIGIL